MIKKLIKIRLLGMLGTLTAGGKKNKTQGKISKGKLALFIFLYVYLGVVFAGMATLQAYSIGALFIPLGFDSLYFGMFMLLTFMIIFILSIFETKSTLYECRDNELLLSMPIQPRDIVVSRISTVMIYNYVECALVMVPAVVIYAVLGGSIFGIIGGITVSLFIPIFATALSSGVGYLVALISKRIKKNTLITVILSLGFLAAYFIGYQYLLEGLDSLAEMSPEVATLLAENLGFLGVIGSAAMLNPIALVIVILLSLVAAFTAYKLISKNYISIITNNKGAARTVYKAKRLIKKSAFSALARKELRAFFSSANYILNAALGAVFGIIIGVMLLVNKEDILVIIDALPLVFPEISGDVSGFVAVIASAFLFAVSSMTFISAPALSLEGRNLWIIKSLPVPAKDVLLAKTVPHIIISSSVSVVSSILMIIALNISPLWWAFVLFIPLVGAFFSAFFGAVIGAIFPKFDYVNDVQVIKQSMATGISMVSTMIIGFGAVILTFLLSLEFSALIAGIIVLAAMTALTFALALLLVTVLARKLERI